MACTAHWGLKAGNHSMKTGKAVREKQGSTKVAKHIVPTPPANDASKIDRLVAMLQQPGGATVAQLASALGWQSHSVRGAISGTLKGKRKLKIRTERPEGGERVYRIA